MIALARALKEQAVQQGGETVEGPGAYAGADVEDPQSLRVDGLRIT
jgi:hypothetical protein